ncbi:MAG: chlorite dismutase family protein [Armatimonadetes bacterium]|nr:chlorite dismutase family protein [Armatimonadota bacterium]MDW8154081.1 chlorite dismutase family protein [Armatimonadota bacterium]
MELARIHGFLFFQVPPEDRTRQGGGRVREAVNLAAGQDGVVAIYTYSLVGFRADAAFGVWIAASRPEAYRAAARCFVRTELLLRDALWGFIRPSPYTGRSGTTMRVPGPRKQYLVVYPFTKTHEWYQLSVEVRRAMMAEHARVGHAYEDIDQLLLYATGLADWEFVVAYETDDLERFSDLVVAMRGTAARPYTLRDIPIYTARYGSVDEVLDEVFGP